MNKTMAEVLGEHHDWAFSLEQGKVLCVGCDWSQKVGAMDPAAEVFRTHQAAALSAAGFGLVTDAKAEAWEEDLEALDNVGMNIPDEAIDAAAKALDPQTMGSGGALAEKFKEDARGEARRILEAAAPYIRAQALEEAADAMWDASPATIQGPDTGRSWLKARAAALLGDS